MIDTYDSLYLFTTITVLCQVDNNGVATRSCNKKLKLPFRKSKLGMQSLSYADSGTWTTLRNTSLRNYLQLRLKRKLQSQSVIRTSITFVFIFSLFKYMLSAFPFYIFTFIFDMSFFLRGHTGKSNFFLLSLLPQIF